MNRTRRIGPKTFVPFLKIDEDSGGSVSCRFLFLDALLPLCVGGSEDVEPFQSKLLAFLCVRVCKISKMKRFGRAKETAEIELDEKVRTKASKKNERTHQERTEEHKTKRQRKRVHTKERRIDRHTGRTSQDKAR